MWLMGFEPTPLMSGQESESCASAVPPQPHNTLIINLKYVVVNYLFYYIFLCVKVQPIIEILTKLIIYCKNYIGKLLNL